MNKFIRRPEVLATVWALAAAVNGVHALGTHNEITPVEQQQEVSGDEMQRNLLLGATAVNLTAACSAAAMVPGDRRKREIQKRIEELSAESDK